MSDIKFLVSVDTKAGTASLKEFEGAVDGLGRTSSTTGGHAEGMFGKIFAGVTASNLATKAIFGLWDQVKSVPAAFLESEKADRALTSALESTGRSIDGNKDHYVAMSKELQRATLFTDEEAMSAQALLLNLTNLDQQGLDKATRGAAGLATTMGGGSGSLLEASRMVAQGMEGNYMSLSRWVPAIRNANTDAEKHTAFLKFMEQGYSRATAETTTFYGRLEMAKKNVDEMKESLGKVILEGLTPFVKLIGEASQTILDLIESHDRAIQIESRHAESQAGLADRIRKAAAAADQSGEMFKRMSSEHQNQMKVEDSYQFALDGTRYKIAGYTRDLGENWEAMRRAIMQEQYGAEVKSKFIEITRIMAEENKKNAKATDEVGSGTGKSTEQIKLAETPLATNRTLWAGIGAELKYAAGILDMLGNTEIPKNRAETAAWTDVLATATGTAVKYEKVLDQLGMKSLKGLKDELKDNLSSQKLLTQAFNQGLIGPNEYAAAMVELQKKIRAAGGANKATAKDVVDDWKKAAAEIAQIFSQIGSDLNSLFSAWSELSSSTAASENQDREESYNYQKKLIEDSKASEEEKAKAIAELDVKYNALRKSQAKEQWLANKNASYAEAVINIAVGVTKAIAQGGLLGIATGIIVAAAGAIQLAAIANRPMPLARGGILDRPTFSADGRYVAGEAGSEAVIPISDRAKKNFNEALERGGRPARGGIVHVHNYIGGRKVNEQIFQIVNEGFQTNKLNPYRRNIH